MYCPFTKSGPEGPECILWSGQRDSNPRMMAWEAIALPLGDARMFVDSITAPPETATEVLADEDKSRAWKGLPQAGSRLQAAADVLAAS